MNIETIRLQSTERVHVSVSGDTAFVTLCDARNRNAVSRKMYHDLASVLSQISPTALRFVVLRGADGLFSSGGDLKEIAPGLPEDYVTDYWQRMTGTILAMRAMPQITIAALEGAAVGAGAAVALSCDMVIAESTSRMRFTFTRIGLLPDAGTTVILPRLLGAAVARDLLFTGRWLGAAEAQQRGLIARTCPVGEIDQAVEELLAELRFSPASALGMVKNLIDTHSLRDLTAGVRAEGVQQYAAAASGEYKAYIDRVLARMSEHRSSQD